MTLNRRTCLRLSTALAAYSVGGSLRAAASVWGTDTPIATNTYPWSTFARRRGRELTLHTDDLLVQVANSGMDGYEPIIEKASEFDGLADRLNAQGLSMRSLYVNSTLHDPNRAEASVSEVLKIAEAAKRIGVEIIVTNPSPIRWGGPENKSDDELRIQAKTLDRLGGQLRDLGLVLAYHNHDAELRMGGREFHHMLTATDPQNVKLCFDAHWVYRGCGNSEVAVFDALEHYHPRIVELHLRQSTSGIWREAFAPEGDIDYVRMFHYLADRKIRPHLVLEQAVESDSPDKLDVVEAHRQGRSNLSHALV